MMTSRIDARLLQQFQDIIRQGRLSHAYLLTGDLTSFDLALYLAQSCFCETLQEGLPCHTCRSCQQVLDQTLVDLVIVEPEGTVIKTQTVREIVAKAATSGLEGRTQVFIVKEADKLHPNAANAMLKMMEEPLGTVYIFLLSRDADNVLPTIRSRCQCFYLPTNTSYWEETLIAGGVSLSQAKLLSQLITSSDELEDYLQFPHLSTLILQTQKFLEAALLKDPLSLLLAARLANLAGERRQQGLVFDLLLLLLRQKGLTDQARVIKAQGMWRAHVTFQSALEYFVLQ